LGYDDTCSIATASSSVAKVQVEVFAHFHEGAAERRSTIRNCVVYDDEFFVNNPVDVKENDELVVGYSLRLSRPFRSRRICPFPFQKPCTVECLSALRGSPSQFFRDSHKMWCTLAFGSRAKSHHARSTIPNDEDVTIHHVQLGT
jgi:hypothetical protein